MTKSYDPLPVFFVSGYRALRATTREVRLDALPPWHVTPPALGPVNPNKFANFRARMVGCKRRMTHVGVQYRQEKIGNKPNLSMLAKLLHSCERTDRSVAGIQLIHEALVPGVDAVPQDLLHYVEQALFPESIALGKG
ncbi:glutamate decarboxylase [Colletotrichum asianum]